MKKLILIVLFVLPLVAVSRTINVDQGFINVPGGPVWYKVSGNGKGLPLLTLHGGPGSTSCNYSLLEPLGDQRPIIRYDQLGSGRSGRPDNLSLWEVDRFVEALGVIRQELQLTQFHLLGHSWGAALAGAYLLEKGTSGVASVIFSSPLLSTPLWIEDANYLRSQLPQNIQDKLEHHEAAGTTNSDEYQAASNVFYKRHLTRGMAKEKINCDGAPWNQVIYEYMWGPTEFFATGNLIDFDLSDRLYKIDIPVLFITGEYDEARPETVSKFQKMIPNSQFVVIKGVAHASLSRAPDDYRKILEEFLDKVEESDQ
ncbi:MAG: proline iminopeptidase-family hydrolase [Woeseiaceae bacterium]|nr:proline iminopeptidase-family hydrolase [Woeseiaceae bacterium]